MITLTYWYVMCQNDSNCYSVRERTKREARATAIERDMIGDPVKVVAKFEDRMEMIQEMMGEGGICEEAQAWREKHG